MDPCNRIRNTWFDKLNIIFDLALFETNDFFSERLIELSQDAAFITLRKNSLCGSFFVIYVSLLFCLFLVAL